MQIFISWSGQASYQVARLLRDLIRAVLPGLEPWVSAEDIEGGNRWSYDLLQILGQSSFSIICADPSNHQSNWLNFEVGAIAKSTDKWNIRVLLYELKPSALVGPLKLYQPVKIDFDEIRRLFEDIHAVMGRPEISPQELIPRLDEVWPEFIQGVKHLSQDNTSLPPGKPAVDLGEVDTGETLAYVDEVDERILALLFVNEGIDEEKISTTVYLGRSECLRHLMNLESKKLVWSKLSFGTRRWYISDLGKKYLPGIYQGYNA